MSQTHEMWRKDASVQGVPGGTKVERTKLLKANIRSVQVGSNRHRHINKGILMVVITVLTFLLMKDESASGENLLWVDIVFTLRP